MTPKEQTPDEKLQNDIGAILENYYNGITGDVESQLEYNAMIDFDEARNEIIEIVTKDRESLLEELKKHAAHSVYIEYPDGSFEAVDAVSIPVIESLLGKGE